MPFDNHSNETDISPRYGSDCQGTLFCHGESAYIGKIIREYKRLSRVNQVLLEQMKAERIYFSYGNRRAEKVLQKENAELRRQVDLLSREISRLVVQKQRETQHRIQLRKQSKKLLRLVAGRLKGLDLDIAKQRERVTHLRRALDRTNKFSFSAVSPDTRKAYYPSRKYLAFYSGQKFIEPNGVCANINCQH